MKNIFRISIAFCLALLTTGGGGVTILNAQTPLARFVLPTNTTSTAVQPTFEIITSLPIDTSSVHWNYEVLDTNGDYYAPTVNVMPYAHYAGSIDSLWFLMDQPGTGVIVNDTTIEFTPDPLPYGREGIAVLRGLRVVSGEDTITIPDTVASITFTTVQLPPKLVSLSFIDSNGWVRTDDTLTARLSSDLDSVNSPSGPIFTLVKPLIHFDTTTDSTIRSDSSVACNAWLDPIDHTKVHILPSAPFSLGENYAVEVKLSGLTGDTTQDGTWGFYVRKSYNLNIVAAPIDGLACLDTVHFNPAINENYIISYDSVFDSTTMTEVLDTSVLRDTTDVGIMLNAGDTVSYSAPTRVGGAVFKQWTGSGIPAIDTSTNPTISVTETADELHNLNIVALYGPVTVDTICVSTAGTNTPQVNSDFVEVRSDSQDCPLPTFVDTCASTSSVNYMIEGGKSVTLSAFSTSNSIEFNSWSSTDSNINGQTSPIIVYNPIASGCVTANFGPVPPPPPPPTPSEMLFVKIFDETTGKFIHTDGTSTVAKITNPSGVSDIWTWWLATDGDVTVPTTIQVLDPSYGLEEYTITYNTPPSTGHIQNFSPAYYTTSTPWSYTIPAPWVTSTSKKYTTVIFYVKKIAEVLSIEVALDDDNLPPGPNLIVAPLPKPGTQTGLWCYDDAQPISQTETNPYDDKIASPNHLHTVLYKLLYLYGTTVNLSCGTDKVYSYLHWDASQPPNTDPTGTPPFTSPNLSLTMDKDRYVTAVFHEPFMVYSIKFNYVAPTEPCQGGATPTTQPLTVLARDWPNATELHDPNNEGIAENNLYSWSTAWPGEYDGSNPVGIEVTFNQPLSTSLLDIPIFEMSNSYFSPNWDYTYAAGKSTTLGEQVPWHFVGDRTIHMDLTLNESGHYAWKGQDLTLLAEEVRSASTGESPSGPTMFNMRTAGPDVIYFYDDTYVAKSHTYSVFGIPIHYSWVWTDVVGQGYEPGVPSPCGSYIYEGNTYDLYNTSEAFASCVDENCSDGTNEIAHNPVRTWSSTYNDSIDDALQGCLGVNLGLGLAWQFAFPYNETYSIDAENLTGRTVNFDFAAACYGLNYHNMNDCGSLSQSDCVNSIYKGAIMTYLSGGDGGSADGFIGWALAAASMIEGSNGDPGVPGTPGHPTLGKILDSHMTPFIQQYGGWQDGWTDFPHFSCLNWWGASYQWSSQASDSGNPVRYSTYQIDANGGATYQMHVELR